jgi:hypothetical protein
MTRPGRAGPPERNPLATPVGVLASSTSKVEQHSRARAASRLASTGRTGVSGARQTRSTVSSSVATTLCQRPSAPGRGTMTRRSRSAPSSAAAASPSSGKPATAHQYPRDDVPASSNNSRLVNPGVRFAPAELGPDVPRAGLRSVSGVSAGPSRTVPPLGSPPPGNSPANSGRTGRIRSAGNGPGAGRGRGPWAAMPVAGRASDSDGFPARAYVATVAVYEHMFDTQMGQGLAWNF